MLRKVRGGATIEAGGHFESDFRFRQQQEGEAMRRMAEAALELVEPGMTVMVNDGSMASALEELLPQKRPLTGTGQEIDRAVQSFPFRSLMHRVFLNRRRKSYLRDARKAAPIPNLKLGSPMGEPFHNLLLWTSLMDVQRDISDARSRGQRLRR